MKNLKVQKIQLTRTTYYAETPRAVFNFKTTNDSNQKRSDTQF